MIEGAARREPDILLFEARSLSLDELESLGRRLARAVRPGDLVVLHGPLGSGKTALVRAVARALGVTDPVRSPSFTLANVYEGPVTVNHLDLYRLDDIGDDDSLALEEYLDSPAVTLVEWPSAGQGRMGEPAFIVEMDHDTPETRQVRLLTRREDAKQRWDRAA